MASESYDVIIIGGGTAGLVLAARLSEDPNLQVLVIEAGSDQKDDPRVVTPALWSTLLKSSTDWAFDTTPQKHLDGRIVPFPQGRILGGTSTINGLVFTPVPKSNVEGWAKLGNTGWDWQSFSQSFNKVFSSTTETPEATSKDFLPVSYPVEPDNNWPSIWKDTLDGLGFSVSDNLFTGQGNGFIVNPESIDPKTKGRTSSQSAFLEPSLGRKNLTVLTEAAVDKIIFDTSDPANVVAKGVQYSQAGQAKVVRAGKEIVLAAGTINSPMLLERSGVGSAELLQRLGIDVVVDNPYVGENLQNHMIVTISSEVKDGVQTKDGLRRQEPAVIAAATEAYGKQSGPFATSGTSVTAQLPFPGIETDEGKRELEQIFATTLIGARNGKYTSAFDRAHKEFVKSILSSPEEASGCYITFPGWAAFNPDGSMAPPPDGETNFFSIGLLNTHPLSRGSTHLKSATGPSPDAVVVDVGYLSHPLDIEIFARNLRYIETLLRSEPLSSQLKPGGKRNPPQDFTNLENGRDFLRRYGLGGNHFVGTCSMMPREMGGVVDSQLRVYGTKNLRVCDASIIPLIPRANPQATVYGVAEHGAQIIKTSLCV
ncbi:hypothetical protein FDECE_7781 [Fusarium decemcellulare]|nr:hypothetical protein FDECE_7781 [Fusarium decemcellulare]